MQCRIVVARFAFLPRLLVKQFGIMGYRFSTDDLIREVATNRSDVFRLLAVSGSVNDFAVALSLAATGQHHDQHKPAKNKLTSIHHCLKICSHVGNKLKVSPTNGKAQTQGDPNTRYPVN